MFEVSNLRSTIVPRSDQINAEQLLSGSMTIRVTDVRIGSTEQPVIIGYQGDNGRPYKPCLTMRKVLIFAWGEDGRAWVGRSMTLYNDPNVKFGGASVGGIRISHLSHIEREIALSLTATKGKKSQHTIKVLKDVPAAPACAEILTPDAVEAAVREGKAKQMADAVSRLPANDIDALWSMLPADIAQKLTDNWPAA